MREIRLSGSEGGVADNGHLYPYRGGGSGLGPVVEIRARRPAGSGRDGVSPSGLWAAGRGGDGPWDTGPTGVAAAWSRW